MESSFEGREVSDLKMKFYIWTSDLPAPVICELELHDPVLRVGRAFICPFCVKLWGIIKNISEGISVEFTKVLPTPAGCIDCGSFGKIDQPGFSIPGSLIEFKFIGRWNSLSFQILNQLPPNLLKREFDLTLKAFLYGQSRRAFPSHNDQAQEACSS